MHSDSATAAAAVDDVFGAGSGGGIGGGAAHRLFDTTDELDELILSLLPPDDLDELQQEAAAFVGRSLQLQPEVEARALSLLNEVNRDRDDALQALRSVTTEQLQSARDGLERYASAEKAMQDLAAAFAQMDALIGTMQSVSSYHQIRQLHHYHENLNSVLKWSEAFAAFDPDKSTIDKDLTDDARCTGTALLDVYQQLKTLQAIRARLAIPAVATANRVPITIVRKQIAYGEKCLDLFLEKIWTIFRRAPTTLVEYVISDKAPKARAEHELLIAAVKIANMEALEPLIYSDLDIAAYQLEVAINRTAGKAAVAAGGGGASGGAGGATRRPGGKIAAALASNATLISQKNTEIVSAINWERISQELDAGTRSLFIESVCRDATIPERTDMDVSQLLSDVGATCDAVELQLDGVCEAVELGMEGIPIGSGVMLLPQIMKTIHAEFCSLIERDYCDPRSNVIVSDLLRVLKLVVFYREQCLERGTLGQFVPPVAVDRVATRVLECAVGGMRDYLAVNARNCVLRVTDKDVAPSQRTGLVGTTGPGDLLYIVSTMLKSVTKNASTDVRIKMSLACSTALRYYVDRFCDKLKFAEFPKWYKTIVEADGRTKMADVANLGDRWVLWVCTGINDFLELQRNVGKLDAALFDLHHQAGGSAAGRGGGDPSSPTSSGGAAGKQSPLQAFAALLGHDVLRKLVSQISDFLELNALAQLFEDATCEASFKPGSDKRSAMEKFVGEVKSYAVESIQPLIAAPWNAVASRSIMFRMIQLYLQRVLSRIYDGMDGSKVTRAVLTARLGDDVRHWTVACQDLADIMTEQLRAEERTDPDVVPDIPGAIAALRAILRFATVDSVESLRAALKEDASQFPDMPEYVYVILFERNKALGDLSSSVKGAMKKLWKAHVDEMAALRKAAEAAKAAALASGGDIGAVDDGGIFSAAPGALGGGAAAADSGSSRRNNGGHDDDDHGGGGGGGVGGSTSKQFANAEMIARFTTPTIFSGLNESQIVPKSTGWFSTTRDAGKKLEIGYRFGEIKTCYETVVLREQMTEIPRLRRQDEPEVISLAELMRRAAAAKEGAAPAAASE